MGRYLNSCRLQAVKHFRKKFHLRCLTAFKLGTKARQKHGNFAAAVLIRFLCLRDNNELGLAILQGRNNKNWIQHNLFCKKSPWPVTPEL